MSDRVLRVLVACEKTGRVREAFRALGHDAWSCDLQDTDVPGQHIVGDALAVLDRGWNILIAHPPCDYLANSGARWLYERDRRWQAMIDGAVFFRKFMEHRRIRFRAAENPVMHGWARKIVGRGPSQYIQPSQFGHLESKRTGLWLDELPPLVPTNDVTAEMLALPKRDTHKVHRMAPGADRKNLRSATYQGVADAMAKQWGDYVVSVLEAESNGR